MAIALTGTVQEGLLCLVAFDRVNGSLVRAILPAELCDNYFRQLAQALYGYWDKYAAPPGDHLLDLVEEIVQRNAGDAGTYRRLYKSMQSSRTGLNAVYLLDQARRFVRRQRLRNGIVQAADLLRQEDEDAAIDAITEATKFEMSVLDPGTDFRDTGAVLECLRIRHEQAFPTGIMELDRPGLGPRRKELHLFLGPKGSGKTWWLVWLGKCAARHRLKVVHITLELSEALTVSRYLQTLFSVSPREGKHCYTAFVKDDLGRVADFKKKEMNSRPFLIGKSHQDNARWKGKPVDAWLAKKLKATKRHTLIVKEFPTGALTVQGLEGYLDFLEARSKVIPDLLIIDYADLMFLSTESYRFDLGKLYKDLRGLAVRRNLAVATASQVNRTGMKARNVRSFDVAEDISKVHTADVVLSYSRTEGEKKHNLARIRVVHARGEEDNFDVAICQQYAVGQFALGSARLSKEYYRLVEPESEEAGS